VQVTNEGGSVPASGAVIAGLWLGLSLAGWVGTLVLVPLFSSAAQPFIAAAWYLAALVLAWRLSGRGFSGRWLVGVLLGTTFPAWIWVWVLVVRDSPALLILVPSAMMTIVLAWITGWRGMIVAVLLAGLAAWWAGKMAGEHRDVMVWVRWMAMPHAVWNAVVSGGLLWWAWRGSRVALQRGAPA
jgi:hypothetical protein